MFFLSNPTCLYICMYCWPWLYTYSTFQSARMENASKFFHSIGFAQIVNAWYIHEQASYSTENDLTPAGRWTLLHHQPCSAPGASLSFLSCLCIYLSLLLFIAPVGSLLGTGYCCAIMCFSTLFLLCTMLDKQPPM